MSKSVQPLRGCSFKDRLHTCIENSLICCVSDMVLQTISIITTLKLPDTRCLLLPTSSAFSLVVHWRLQLSTLRFCMLDFGPTICAVANHARKVGFSTSAEKSTYIILHRQTLNQRNKTKSTFWTGGGLSDRVNKHISSL